MQNMKELAADQLSPVLREGLVHHGNGRMPEATLCYQRAHEENPDDAEALLLLGIVARETKHFSAAIELTRLAIERRPQAAHIHANLALAYHGARDCERAVECCRQALALDPLNERTWCSLAEIEAGRGDREAARAAYEHGMKLPSASGLAALALGHMLCQQEQYEQGQAAYTQGISQVPSNAHLHLALGAALFAVGNANAAKAAYGKALELQPNFPEAYLNLGNALYHERNFVAAALAYRCAIALRPHYVKAHCNLGNALQELGRHTEAVACYEAALALESDTAPARHNLGNALLHLREYQRAEECFRSLVQPGSEDAEHHNSLGNALLQQRRTAEAEECYRRAIQLKPDYAAAHTNLGNALLALGKRDEMKLHYRRGNELDPTSAGGQYNLALACLREGNLREGWQRHEWRWEFRELNLPRKNFKQPQWKGQQLNGATIFLHAEQGIGDTLQFVRYIPLVVERGGRVLLEVQPELHSLLKTMDGPQQVTARGEDPPQFAYHCPLMSLPLAFETDIDTIPSSSPYLRVDPAAVDAAWRAHPRQDNRLRVGLVWAGNPRFKGDQQRSTTLEALLPLAELTDVTFFSLQFGTAAAQIAASPSYFPLIDACSQNKDFADTASVVATLDLVISVDTAVAHLAGAMGVPIWVLLPHLADWRWLEKREDSPWYPTARLFRQTTPGDWRSVAERVRDELQKFVDAARKSS
jgi:tetratricopeptide (TPR) repeat protein